MPEANKAITELSTIKQQKLRKEEKNRLKNEMRKALPVLNWDDIRRYRQSYDMAILAELTENGFVSTAFFVKDLINFHEELRNSYGPDTLVWVRPRLLKSKETLDKLVDALKTAEAAHNSGSGSTECDELLKIGAYFAFGSQDWWWLGEQLLTQALLVCSAYQNDGGRRDAFCQYILGKYLLENADDETLAVEYLNKVRKSSMGKMWNAAKIIGHKEDIIFVETNRLLYKTLLKSAKIMKPDNPLAAAKLCAVAGKRAIDACNRKGEADALVLQGLCHMDADHPTVALTLFMKALGIQSKAENNRKICDAQLYIALAHTRMGNFEETITLLKSVLEFVQENDWKLYIADTLRYLGECYLLKNEPAISTPLINQALDIYVTLEEKQKTQQCTIFSAISTGEAAMPKFVELLLASGVPDEKGQEALSKLNDWKDIRKVPWAEEIPEETESLISTEPSEEETVIDEEIIKPDTSSSSGSSKSQLSMVDYDVQIEASGQPVSFLDLGNIEIHEVLDVI